MIDKKDKEILYELDRNSRINLNQLAKKVNLKKETLNYRINKLIETKIILKFHTVSALYRLGQKSYKLYLKLKNASLSDRNQIIDYALKKQHIFWIGNSRGKWDLIIGIWASNLNDFFDIQDEILNQFHNIILNKNVTISKSNLQISRRWIYDKKEEIKTFDFGENESFIDIDEDDKQILNCLSKNSRIKISEITKKTNLLPDKIRIRIKKLEDKNIIKGYKCLFNTKLLGYVTTKSNLYLQNITLNKKKELIEYIKNIPNVIYILEIFGNWDLEIGFEVENSEKYYAIMDELCSNFKDVINYYDDIIIISEPKQDFIISK